MTVSVGHCHPYVLEAVNRQMRELWHSTYIYLHPNIHKYAEKLTSKFSGDLKVPTRYRQFEPYILNGKLMFSTRSNARFCRLRILLILDPKQMIWRYFWLACRRETMKCCHYKMPTMECR